MKLIICLASCGFHPKNHVLPFLGEHFSDRLPQENFMIYDASHSLAALHPQGKGFFLTDTCSLNEDILNRFSPEELEYQKLWCGFLKRFQKDVIEFQKKR